MKRLLALLLCLSLLPLNVPLLRADDSDIFGANIQPNIMIFIDNSGSMDDTILSDPYNPALTYTGTYTSTVVYQYKKKAYQKYADTVSAVNSASAQTALNTVGYWSGKISGSTVNLYLGGYLNWQASPGAQQVKKIDIAKQVLTDLITHVEGVRFGLSAFTGNANQGQGGARIVAPMGSTDAALLTALNGITPSGYTPLGEALRDLGNYYKGTFSGYSSPIQYECQPNFIILMTDGMQNGTMDVRVEARNRYTQDHSALTGLQNVIVDTIGFALSDADKADGANDILQTAATNGGGKFYDTDSQQALEAALQDAIRRIVAATFTFATPVIPTTSATGLSRAYLAAVQSNPSRPFWRGFVKAFNRDANGQVQTNTDGTPNENCTLTYPDGSTKPCLAWEAGNVLTTKSPTDRTIYTVIGGTLQAFTKANSNLTQTLLGVSTSTDRDKVIDFIRGVDSTDENGNGNVTEDRQWKLGDVFHSTPVVVSAPFLPSSDSTYTSWRDSTAIHGRTTVVLVGTNDGMLHAFRESDGVELWAFIPPDQLSRLNGLLATTGEHLYYVDSSPMVADVQVAGQWKTVVVFGERRGGPYYHALDITDTTSPQYMWSFTDSKIAETWSEPIIGKIQMASSAGSTGNTGNAKYVAFFGGGFDTAQNNQHGKAFFAVDVGTGTKLWEYYNVAGNTDDRRYMNFSLPADPLAVDKNSDGFIDALYIGDVGGQLWKFDLSAATTLAGGTTGLANNWLGKRFFVASPSQANPPAAGEYYPAQGIYDTANAAFDTQQNLWVYFGTGDRDHPNSATNVTGPPAIPANRFYGIKDNTTMTNGSALTESNLVDVTASSTVPAQGWYVPLGSSEKVLSPSNVFNSVVFFSSFTSSGSSACGSGGGTAKLYAVQMTSGFAAINWSTNAVYAQGGSSTTTERGKVIGQGIPSKPIVIVNDQYTTVSASVIEGTTNQTLSSNPAPPPTSMRRILYWREAF